MSARYVPGESLVLVTERSLVATGAEHVDRLLTLLDRELVALAVIEALSGGSLSALTDFACVLVDGDDLRIVLRGSYSAVVDGQELSGAGVATWVEQTFPGAAEHSVLVRAGDPSCQGPELPLSTGVVLASQVAWASNGSATASSPLAVSHPAPVEPVAEPVPVVVPEPEIIGISEPVAAAEDVATPEPEQPGPVSSPDQVPEETMIEFEEAEPEPNHPVAETDPEPEELAELTEQPVLAPVLEDPAEPDDAPGDHDGRTITADQLRALREQQAPVEQIARAEVVLPDGTRHPVAPRVLLGRRPEARQLASGGVPTLVTVDGPYVSSTHLEVVVEGPRVLATDLSTNGTVMMQPGQPAQALVKGQATEVIPGTVLALADDFAVTIDLAAGG